MNTTPQEQIKAINRSIMNIERDYRLLERQQAEARAAGIRRSKKRSKNTTAALDMEKRIGETMADLQRQSDALTDARNVISQTATFRLHLKTFMAQTG